jgi:hypothetical protein
LHTQGELESFFVLFFFRELTRFLLLKNLKKRSYQEPITNTDAQTHMSVMCKAFFLDFSMIYIFRSFFIIFFNLLSLTHSLSKRKMINGVWLEHSCTYFKQRLKILSRRGETRIAGMLETLFLMANNCFSQEEGQRKNNHRRL